MDLQNAFASVPHKLINDMLQLMSLPLQIHEYVAARRLLTATVFTNTWSTGAPNFKVRVQRGRSRQHTFTVAIFAVLQPHNCVCQTLTKLWIPDDGNANFPYLSHAHEKAKLRQPASGPKPNYTEGSSCCWLIHLCRVG